MSLGIHEFLEAKCWIEPNASVSSSDLFVAYTEWAEENHTPHVSHMGFSSYVSQLPFIQRKKASSIFFIGIQLKTEISNANLKVSEALLLSIGGGCLDYAELKKRHWPLLPTHTAGDCLKGTLNRIRNRHHWVLGGSSLVLTHKGLLKYSQLLVDGSSFRTGSSKKEKEFLLLEENRLKKESTDKKVDILLSAMMAIGLKLKQGIPVEQVLLSISSTVETMVGEFEGVISQTVQSSPEEPSEEASQETDVSYFLVPQEV